MVVSSILNTARLGRS